MQKEDLKFEIDQLRKDKIIYALEAIATIVAAFLFMMTASFYFPEADPRYSFAGSTLIGLGYWLFTVYGNTKRFMRIKKLEKLLKRK